MKIDTELLHLSIEGNQILELLISLPFAHLPSILYHRLPIYLSCRSLIHRNFHHLVYC